MTLQEAMQKAAKLLRLAQSDNANEAALAASKAQEIIDAYRLNIDSVQMDEAQTVESNEPIKDFGSDPLTQGNKLARWKGYLLIHIAAANQCTSYRTGGRLKLVGRPSDVAVARYFFSWISAEIERIANRECVGNGRTYWDNFRVGAVESVAKKLRAQHEQTISKAKDQAAQISAHALMIVNTNALRLVEKEREVKEWVKANLGLRAGRASSARYDHSAREAGRRAGASINIGSKGNLGGGPQRRLA